MHDKPRGAEDDGATTAAELDVRDQAAVLRHVLSLYPQTLTESELLKEMSAGTGGRSPSATATGERFAISQGADCSTPRPGGSFRPGRRCCFTNWRKSHERRQTRGSRGSRAPR